MEEITSRFTVHLRHLKPAESTSESMSYSSQELLTTSAANNVQEDLVFDPTSSPITEDEYND